MWRMNGAREEKMKTPSVASLLRLLLLGALLLSDGVMCQEDTTLAAGTTVMDGSVEPSKADTDVQDPATPGATTAQPDATPEAGATDAADASDVFTMVTDIVGILDVLGGGSTALADPEPSDSTSLAPEAPETPAPPQLMIPQIKCQEKEAIGEVLVTAVVDTRTCEETKAILEKVPAAWCADDGCRLDVSQDGNTLLVASPDATSGNIQAALQSESIKGSLGVSDVKPASSSSGASVFVGILLTGLLLAAGLIGGYCFKNRRTTEDKGIRLAEEAYPVDGENQGNTLVSVAPLNPPPESQEPTETTEIPEVKGTAEPQEKPSANGDAPEEAKPEADADSAAVVLVAAAPEQPPTNGTAAKTADTEL